MGVAHPHHRLKGRPGQLDKIIHLPQPHLPAQQGLLLPQPDASGSAVVINGACAEGARVEVLRNGAKIGDAAVTGTTWNYTIDTATAAEKYSVRQYVPGFAAATSEEKTVAGE